MKIKIKYLDGLRLKRSIIASARHIYREKENLNHINVFPVADGDTGTNMVSTMNHIAEAAENCRETSIETVSDSIADSALNGARGNSGVILAQFFQGLAQATKGKVRLTTHSFAQAMNNAVDQAREAIVQPRDGTILTVMRDWASHLNKRARTTSDFGVLLKESLVKTRESLAETPKKLKVLSRAGVVDAGAQGFVNLLEGISVFIDSGKIVASKAKSRIKRQLNPVKERKKPTYRYCTECLIRGEAIEKNDLRDNLIALGNSLIVVGSRSKVRIHIHTNAPQRVFSVAAAHGALLNKKVDDMLVQHAHLQNKTEHIAVVTDTTCDISEEVATKYNIHLVPVLIQVGNKSFRDKIDMTHDQFYTLLQHSAEKITTSQPPPALYRKTYDRVFQSCQSALSIHLSSALSGTLQSGKTSSRNQSYQHQLHFIDSKTLSAGLGLVVEQAAALLEKGWELTRVKADLEKIIESVRFFIALPSLKYVIRSGRLSKPQGFLATLLHIKPVLATNSEGKLVPVVKTFGKNSVFRKTVALATDYAQSLSNPVFRIVHANAHSRAISFRHAIQKRFQTDDISILTASPALGVYAGIGAAGIAVIDKIE